MAATGPPRALSSRAVTVRLVTDSNAMLPPDLRDRFSIMVVPLTVVIDGADHREDTLDPVEFCDRLRSGATVSTSAPSPGELLTAYQEAASGGATEVLSVHIGSNQSATVAAAQGAARMVDLPVIVVDTGTASFIEGCCVWRAGEALADGASVAEAAAAAEQTAGLVASVFTIGEIDRARAGGRLVPGPDGGVPVFASRGAEMRELRRAATVEAATEAMVAAVAEHDGPLRVGVGDADAPDAAAALLDALSALPQVVETIRYTVGPSVAAHTGAGTFGAVYHPLEPAP